MALLHRATLVPSKGELVGAWLPGRPWALGDPIVSGVSYRLDDPAGEVGMEGFLLTDGDGGTVHVPLSYRGSRLAGADRHLLGTMEHSVLGTRWVYDGVVDPVWVGALAATIVEGGTQADELVDVDGEVVHRDPQVTMRGSGKAEIVVPPVGAIDAGESDSSTIVSWVGGELVVVRRVGCEVRSPHTLLATWGQDSKSTIAGFRLTDS